MRKKRVDQALLLSGALSLTFLACGWDSGEPETSRSPDAKLDTVATLQEDLRAPRHPADGTGAVWLISPVSANGEPEVPVGGRERFHIAYAAGPLGVAVGGAVYLQPSPFWGWDAPQIESPEGPGYSTATTSAHGVELHLETPGGELLAIHIRGRSLEPGERIDIVYGDGPAGARVDRFAEQRSRLWVAVDGDGDRVRSILADSPSVNIVAHQPAILLLTLPSSARPGESVRLTAAIVDPVGNGGVPFAGEVSLEGPFRDLGLPETIVFETQHKGSRSIEGVVHKEGVYRVTGHAVSSGADSRALTGESNPLVVRQGIPRLLWGDLHGHSQISDGSGTPEDYFRYARDIAALDVAALTDHDHWGMRFLDQSPESWEEIQAAARAFHEPGRFVSLAGYEWTSWLHGHRHVIFFSDHAELLSSMDPRYETPDSLWRALAGSPAITVAHHSAGGPISTNWSFVPDPEIEPVTEIVSAHGSSEAADSPALIYDPVGTNFVRDALDHGMRFGFVGGGDGHDGHPGLTHLGAPSGGLAAIFCETLDRESVLQAIRSRSVYATNGSRIWLRVWLDEQPMGSILRLADGGSKTHEIRFAVSAPAAVARVEVVRSGHVIDALDGEGRRDSSEARALPDLRPGEYVYLRVILEDGGLAWSSPISVEEAPHPVGY